MVRFHPQWRRAHEIVATGAIGDAARDPDLFLLPAAPTPRISATSRRAAAASTTSAATRSCRRAIFSAPSRRAWPRRSTSTRISAPTGWPSAILEFPGGRHFDLHLSARNVGASARHDRRATAGRIEIIIPFNAPPDRPTEITIDAGADLFGGGAPASSSFPSATNTRCRATPSRARSSARAPLEFPIEDAIEHARHRRPVPLGEKRSVGEAVERAASGKPTAGARC